MVLAFGRERWQRCRAQLAMTAFLVCKAFTDDNRRYLPQPAQCQTVIILSQGTWLRQSIAAFYGSFFVNILLTKQASSVIIVNERSFIF